MDTLHHGMDTLRYGRVMPRLPVADLRKAVEFYTQTLGFDCGLWPDDDAPTLAVLARDGVNVQFYLPEPRGSEPVGHGTLSFEVSDVRALHKRLSASLPVEWGPEVYHYRRREFAVRDPSGYLAIFTEETDDPPTCAPD
jgi:catechol 2,3-dioxygenase-like lactoylglutathione lyase family enzyme